MEGTEKQIGEIEGDVDRAVECWNALSRLLRSQI